MLDNLIFCLNATIPIFLLMLLGLVFMKLHIFDVAFVEKMNAFVFKVALPVLVFYELCREDFYAVWDAKYVLFCFFATLLSIGIVTALSFLLRDKSVQGEFIQVSYRSSAAIMGIALVQNLYGNAGMTPLMIVGSVPLYNIFAVIVLSLFQPERKPLGKGKLLATAKGVVTNPILIGVLAGLLWAVCKLPLPAIADKTLENISRLATPLGLMAVGAAFDFKKALSGIQTAAAAAFIKLIGLACIFLPLAAAFGFTGDKLAATLIMCGSPTTVSCYIMAKNMGHDGTLTSSTIMLTTFFSAFTLTGWLFLLKTLGLL